MDMEALKRILEELIVLLSSVGETNWSQALIRFRQDCDFYELQDDKGILTEIMGIFGGMGSFSDLVLYKQRRLLVEENQKLDELRRRLFEALKNAR